VVRAYRRQCADDHRLVCINFSDQPHAHPHAGDWHVEIASDGIGENAPYNGTLNPGQAVVLRPMEN
jgi:alpha-glucosidase